MLRETSILHLFQYIVQNKIAVENDEILNTCMRLTELIVTNYDWAIDVDSEEVDQNRQEVLAVSIGVSQTVLSNSRQPDSTNRAAKALSHLADQMISEIPKLASADTISRLLQKMETKDPDEYSSAIQCLSSFSASEDHQVVMRAIQGGLFPRCFEILASGCTQDKIYALFVLSNITGDTCKAHIEAFF